MNLVDSSAWLEYLTDGPNASYFSPVLEQPAKLIIPVICVFEVFKKVLKEKGIDAAIEVVALMQQGEVVHLDAKLSMEAAKLSLEFKLHMADSIILATARAFGAVIWTQDADFEKIDGVKFIRARK